MVNREKVIKRLERARQLDFDMKRPTQDAIDYALSMLKEHEAVEPFHRCIGKLHTLIEDSHFDYCPYCGKPISWEGR